MLRVVCSQFRFQQTLRCCTALIALLLTAAQSEAFAPKVIDLGRSSDTEEAESVIAITGGVEQPGMYRFSGGEISLSRIVEQAGGLSEEAGAKVDVLRGGRARIVLFYKLQSDYRIKNGDVVLIERASPSQARVISLDRFQPQAKSAKTQVVSRASREQKMKRFHGHVVLLGLQDYPVVMPLWERNLTADKLLSNWLKQPEDVVQQTRLVAGRYASSSEQTLQDGLVLQVPAGAVDHASLPQLPAIQTVSHETAEQQIPEETQPTRGSEPGVAFPSPNLPEQETENGGSDLKAVQEPEGRFSQKSPQGNDASLLIAQSPSNDETERKDGEETSSALPDRNLSRNGAEEEQESSVPQILQNVREEPSGYRVEKIEPEPEDDRQNMHLANADEVVPAPVEPKMAAQTASFSPIGLFAGSIVLIGVVTVIIASVRAHLTQSGLFGERRQQVAPVSEPISQPVAETGWKPEQTGHDEQEQLLRDLADDRLPTIEERVLMPRELKFFGKPQRHYEFRIDAAHEIPKPHMARKRQDDPRSTPAADIPARKLTKDDVQWQGQCGLGYWNDEDPFDNTTSAWN